MAAALFVVLSLLGSGARQPESLPRKPAVAPLFMTSEPGRGPAFLVSCLNLTALPHSSASDIWPLKQSALRVDGQVLDDEGGRIGPGLTSEVRPGETWRGIIELWQTPQPISRAVAFGALVRAPFLRPLSAGKHTLAVRCGSEWSDDLVFFVEQ
jgi:hypothetical protein